MLSEAKHLTPLYYNKDFMIFCDYRGRFYDFL